MVKIEHHIYPTLRPSSSFFTTLHQLILYVSRHKHEAHDFTPLTFHAAYLHEALICCVHIECEWGKRSLDSKRATLQSKHRIANTFYTRCINALCLVLVRLSYLLLFINKTAALWSQHRAYALIICTQHTESMYNRRAISITRVHNVVIYTVLVIINAHRTHIHSRGTAAADGDFIVKSCSVKKQKTGKVELQKGKKIWKFKASGCAVLVTIYTQFTSVRNAAFIK